MREGSQIICAFGIAVSVFTALQPANPIAPLNAAIAAFLFALLQNPRPPSTSEGECNCGLGVLSAIREPAAALSSPETTPAGVLDEAELDVGMLAAAIHEVGPLQCPRESEPHGINALHHMEDAYRLATAYRTRALARALRGDGDG